MKRKYFLKMNDNANYEKYLRRESYSSSTIRYHISCVTRLQRWAALEQLEITELGYTDLVAYVKWLRDKGAGKIGMSRYLTVLKTYFNYLVDRGDIKENPANYIKLQGIPRKKLYDIFTSLELESLYHKYLTTPVKILYPSWEKIITLQHARNKVMLGLLLYQGIKAEELYKLECNDVKLREGEIEIREGKRSNSRVLKLEAAQIMGLHQYLSEERKAMLQLTEQETDLLFVSVWKKQKLHLCIYKFIKELRKLDPRLRSLEQLRASVIVKWLKRYNLRQVQYMAGHRFISSTEKFMQDEMEGLTEEVHKFHPLG